MASSALSLATAREYVAALLAADGQDVPPAEAEAERLARMVAELGIFVCADTAEAHELVATPGLLRAAFATARRAPGMGDAWAALGPLTITRCREDGDVDGRRQRVAEVLAAGAAVFFIETAFCFSREPDMVAGALAALAFLRPRRFAHTWRGLPGIALSGLRLYPSNEAVVIPAAKLLECTARTDPTIAVFVVDYASSVTAAMAALGEDTPAETACIRLLGAASAMANEETAYGDKACDVFAAPAVLRAAVRVLRASSGSQEKQIAAAAHLLSYVRGDSLVAIPGIASALVGALKSAPASDVVQYAICRVFYVLREHMWDLEGHAAFFVEARTAGGFMPIAMALRACAVARGENAADKEQAGVVLSAAAAIAIMETPPGHDDSDIDEALRAGAAVAAMALARRYADDRRCVSNTCAFLKGIALKSESRCKALVAAGAFKTAAAVLLDFAECCDGVLWGLELAAEVVTGCKPGDPDLAAAAGRAGLIEPVARALATHGESSADVAFNASGLLASTCGIDTANQARAIAAGAPAALAAALRAHACADDARIIVGSLHDVLFGYPDFEAAASAASAGAVPAIVATMQAHLDDEVAQALCGCCLRTVVQEMTRDERCEALRDSPSALASTLEAAMRRYRTSERTMGILTQAAVCLYGGPEMTRIISVLADLAQDTADSELHDEHSDASSVLAHVYHALGEAAAQYSAVGGACLTSAQLATALDHAKSCSLTNQELVMTVLATIALYVRADASLAASLAKDAIFTAVLFATEARQSDYGSMLRSTAAALFSAAVGHGGSVAEDAESMGHVAGILQLLEDGGALPELKFWGASIEAMRPALLARLRKCFCGFGGCYACSKLRAAGKCCNIPGCGASRRMDDAERMMAKCGRCRRFAYCCKAHQTDDWPRHKEECRALAAAQADDDEEADDAEE